MDRLAVAICALMATCSCILIWRRRDSCLAACQARDLNDIVVACVAPGHHVVESGAGLGAVKASSLRSDAAFRGASDLDLASAQRVKVALT